MTFFKITSISGTVSYKVHKQVSKPKEDWIKVEHTHEPLVSSRNRGARVRPPRSASGRFSESCPPANAYRMGCRFIALNDGVDTIHKNNEMLVILKNVMNDLYARDTSSKIHFAEWS